VAKKEKKQIEASGDVWEEMGALEAISVAIYNEQAAFEFYNGLVDVIENEGGKSMFRSFAADEKRHRQHLEKRYGTESCGGAFVFDPGRVKQITFSVDSQTGAIDAVELAIEAEKEACAFYQDAARKTRDEAGKHMFEALAADEDRHHEMLLAEREALLGHFYWFGADDQRFMEG